MRSRCYALLGSWALWMFTLGSLNATQMLQLEGKREKGRKTRWLSHQQKSPPCHNNAITVCRCLRETAWRSSLRATKGTMAEALESTALEAGVKRSEAGHEKGEKKVYNNTAGRRPFASQQEKASMALCSEAWKESPSLKEWCATGTGSQRGCEISLPTDTQSLTGQGPEQPNPKVALFWVWAWTRSCPEPSSKLNFPIIICN